MASKQIIAVVGRPNVGKSTFVNRLIGSRSSIVDDMPGVTRDRIYFDVEWLNKEFTVIDTGGIIPGDEDEIMLNIFSQAQLACDEADKIIFIVDGKDGLNPIDYDIANVLRKSGKKVFLAVNKIDSIDAIDNASEFWALSMGEPVAISATHGSGGIGDLLDMVTEDIEPSDELSNEGGIKIAIVGRPNVGKSSITNALLDKNRVIVSDVSGTTRDSIDSKIIFENKEYTLIDTAGIRKKSKVDWGVEKFAVDRAIRSIREADVAVLVIDATEGITDQDKKISSIIQEAGKAMILAVNKWDLVEDKKSNTLSNYQKKLENDVPFLDYVPKIFISALTKQRLTSIYKEADNVYVQWKKRVSTSLLNKVINDAIQMNQPSSIKGKRIRIFYTTQVKDSPPTFVSFVNDPKLLQDHYKRYLEKQLREAFGFFGTPIRFSIREKKGKE